MAAKKTAAKKPVEVQSLSNQEIVLNKYILAACKPVKNGFCIFNQEDNDYALFDSLGTPLHSGLAKTEQDAWKLAAHAVL
jgi:hypothetical protein